MFTPILNNSDVGDKIQKIVIFKSERAFNTPPPYGSWHVLKVYNESLRQWITIAHLDGTEFVEMDVLGLALKLADGYNCPFEIWNKDRYLEVAYGRQ